MKITNKVHTGTAIAAAVLAILATLGNIVSSVANILSILRYSSIGVGSYIFSIAGNIIGMILIVVALLRRKKDSVAGVLFIIEMLITFVAVFGNIRTMFAGYGSVQTIAALIRILAMMACVVFYALLTVECFTPGKISGSSVKILPVIAPVIYMVLLFIATLVSVIPESFNGSDVGLVLVSVLVPVVMNLLGKIWMIILGLAFSIPVYEKPSFESLYHV